MAIDNIFSSRDFAPHKVVIVLGFIIYLFYFDKFLDNKVNASLRMGIEYLITPVYNVNSFIKKEVQLLGDYLISNKNSAELAEKYETEQAKLKVENTNLKNELLSYKSSTSILKNIQQSSNFKTLSRIVSLDNQGVRLNVGEQEGAYKDDLVVNQDGVVGYITDTEENTSKVMLITNEKSVISAKSLSQNLIINGTGEMNKLIAKLNLEDEAKKFKVGDLVYTSNLGGIYPEGYKIGSITDITYNALENNYYLIITPSADLNALDFLAVVGIKNKELKF